MHLEVVCRLTKVAPVSPVFGIIHHEPPVQHSPSHLSPGPRRIGSLLGPRSFGS